MRLRASVALLLALAMGACSDDSPAAGVDGQADTTEDSAAPDSGAPPDTSDASDAKGPHDVTSDVDAAASDAPLADSSDPDVADALPDATDAGPDADAGVTLPDAATPAVDAPHALLAHPIVGTGSFLANVGSAYPGAARPFGLVKASPDTLLGETVGAAFHCAGYQYTDPFIHGFSHNHLHGTGAPDYGNLALMPALVADEKLMDRWERRAPFNHEAEVAQPGYYAVTLTEPHVRVETTATTRCAHHRLTFLDHQGEGVVALDLGAAMVKGKTAGGSVKVDAATGALTGETRNVGEFSGRYDGFPIHFAARTSRPPSRIGTWTGATLQPDVDLAITAASPASLGAYLVFDLEESATVELQLCVSYVDIDGASAALLAELPDWDFDGTRAEALLDWEAELSVIDVEGGTPEQQSVLYTSLYHVMQMPTIWSDVDGRYRGFDGEVHTAEGWTYYTDMSLWDTFRTQHPLIALLWPDRQRDMVRSLEAMLEQGGYLPQWPMGMGDTGSMIGQHAAVLVSDSVQKGIVGYDVDALWDALHAAASAPSPPGSYGGRECMPHYIDYGYCPADLANGSVSVTLELAFDDFCLARLADSIGLPDEAAVYDARSKGYAHLWDPETAFFRPRNADGTLTEPWSPTVWSFSNEFYVEGSAWQWAWFVPHDEPGLRALFGSDEAFVDKLSMFFEKSKAIFDFAIPSVYYFHGNEPDIHAPFLFTDAGRPDLTRQWTRWVLESAYRDTYDGLVGNDDAGTLGAWYVLASIGLYPTPCVPGYRVTAPLFDRAVVRLPGGDVVIEAGPNVSEDPAPTWNGAPLQGFWVDHEPLSKGGTLRYGE